MQTERRRGSPKRVGHTSAAIIVGLVALGSHRGDSIAYGSDRSDVDWDALYHFTPCEPGEPCPVVVARHDLVAGQAISGADVALVQVQPDARWNLGVAHSFDEVMGRRVGERILDGEPIREARLRAPPVRGDAARQWVVDGMRLMSLRLSNVGPPMAPGVNIDVWQDEEDGACRVAQVVPVVGVQDLDDHVSTVGFVPSQVALVVLVSPTQARRLAALDPSTPLHPTVRPSHDIAFVEADACRERP